MIIDSNNKLNNSLVASHGLELAHRAEILIKELLKNYELTLSEEDNKLYTLKKV